MADVVADHRLVDNALDAAEDVLEHRRPGELPHGAAQRTLDDRAIKRLDGAALGAHGQAEVGAGRSKIGGLTVPVESPTLYQIDVRLRSAGTQPLPGGDAHRLLAPRPRPGWRPGEVPDHATPAAALVLLYPLDDDPHVLLTVRAGRLGKHAGQVSFPGGLIDDGESVAAAALREAFEEVGLDPAGVRLVGTLSPLYITVSNFTIHPVVGIAAQTPVLRRSAAEVARLLPVSLADLADPGNLRRGTRWRDALHCDVPYFALRNERVWGATAMVLGELLALLDLGPRNPW